MPQKKRTRKKPKNIVEQALDGLETVERIVDKVGELKEDLADMLGPSEYERHLDRELERLQADRIKHFQKREYIATPRPCPNCGGPHKAYECPETAEIPPRKTTFSRPQDRAAVRPEREMQYIPALQVLGIDPATFDELPPEGRVHTVREAYKRLARIWHPDKTGVNTNDKMAEINRAYQYLLEVLNS